MKPALFSIIEFAFVAIFISFIAGLITALIAKPKRHRALGLPRLALLLFVCFGLWTLDFGQSTARAADQAQTDTNVLAVVSTNTFILYHDVSGSYTNGQAPGSQNYIFVTKGNDVWLECGGFFTNSTANASNVTYNIAASVSGSQWTNNYATVVLAVPGASTNYASAILYIAHPPPFLGWRTIANTNKDSVTGRTGAQFVKAYVKDGI